MTTTDNPSSAGRHQARDGSSAPKAVGRQAVLSVLRRDPQEGRTAA